MRPRRRPALVPDYRPSFTFSRHRSLPWRDRWTDPGPPPTKEPFLASEAIRRSGLADTSKADKVGALARDLCDVALNREDVPEIARDYERLRAACTRDEVQQYVEMVRVRDRDANAQMEAADGS